MIRNFLMLGLTLLLAASLTAQDRNADVSKYSPSEQVQMTDRLVWLIKNDQIDGLISTTDDASRYTNDSFRASAKKAASFIPEFSSKYWASHEEIDQANGVHKVYLVFKGSNNECSYMMEVHYPLNSHTPIKHIEFHEAGTFNQICASLRR